METIFPSASPEFLYANLLSRLWEGYALLDPDPLDAYPSIEVGQIVDMRGVSDGLRRKLLTMEHPRRLFGRALGQRYR
jgi:hypothetical protein